LILLLAACIPARTPDNLRDTPGPAVVVTDRSYDAGTFTLQYPGGWRIVTGPAGAPTSVVFVAPDEVSNIRLQVGALDTAQLDGKLQTDVRGLTLADGTRLTAVGSAPAKSWDSFQPIYEQVLASVKGKS
jgi:hypothetical protein